MKTQRSKYLKWSIGALLATTVTAAIGQSVFFNQRGPFFYDRSFGTEAAVQQLMNHAQLVENEILLQRKEIAELKKSLKESEDKFAKLEKRVRAMELRGK